ncbi:hypothetical protein BS467_04175 [Bacillus altitudinis]|nr:hypothetical protein BS467_04175 [Bacillus altitudinis]
MSVLRSGAHECQIRSAPVLVLPRLQRFSITLKRRQSPFIRAFFFWFSPLHLFRHRLERTTHLKEEQV